MADDGGPLPPGWDRKYDHRTGRHYYINYFNKTTTWEDPRSRYRQLNQVTPQHVPAPTMVENIPLQQPSRAVRSHPTFPSSPPLQVSPHPYRQTLVHFQDVTNVRPSPIPGRVAGVTPSRGTPYASPVRTSSGTMESSLTTEVDVAAGKIGAMFPTVSDTHIRTLLIKYHNREAVVVSALQVEKHPLTTPGPYTTPPTAARRPGQAVWEGGSGYGSRAGSPAPRPPHSSPKMKLRYLKSVFPKVEETLLLDILSSSDNNVQKATEKLVTMGFEKRDTPPPRLTLRAKAEEAAAAAQLRLTAQPTPPPRMKSTEEKHKMKVRLQERYRDVPDRIIVLALESVDYDEVRAGQILQFTLQDEERVKSASSSRKEAGPSTAKVFAEGETKVTDGGPSRAASRKTDSPVHKTDTVSPAHKAPVQKISPVSITSHSKRAKNKKDVPRMSRGTCTAEDAEYRSPYLSKPYGPNPDLHHGANDDLLLADYVTWSGPNPELLQTPSPRMSLAKGPDASLLGERTYKAKGPNADLRKGPLRGLAKGSIYSRLTASATAHISEESRGK